MARKPVISIVDDDESAREGTADLIKSLGFTAREFSHADGFLHSKIMARTACLIADVRMPGMGGLELQRRLALSQPKLPVVFITAHCADEDVRSRTLKDGAVAYLSKPLSEEAVLSAVEAALKTKGRGSGHE